MTTRLYILNLVFLFLLTACDNSLKNRTTVKKAQSIDTSLAIYIDNYWAIPQKNFKINKQHTCIGDTLKLITCDEYVFSPFGRLKTKADIEKCLLKKFSKIDRIDTMDIGAIELQILKFKSSRLILFFDNDPEATKHSFIFKGNIVDSDVDLLYGIKIGMSKEKFLMTFFETFPKILSDKYNNIVIESCIENISQIYSFKDDKLQSINFKTNSYWTINY